MASRFDKRLVEQEGLGVAHEGPAHGDPLALSTGELGGLAVEELVQLEQVSRPLHSLRHIVVGGVVEAEREGDVLVHVQVRIEGVVLEHHGEVAVSGRLVVDLRVTDVDVARGDVLEADDHAQDRGLPAS